MAGYGGVALLPRRSQDKNQINGAKLGNRFSKDINLFRDLYFLCGNRTFKLYFRRIQNTAKMAAPSDQRIAVPIDDPNADTEW